MTRFVLKNCDMFYISYDEPNAEHNWSRVRACVPGAKRVHGIKGFESAHKICAKASVSQRFVTIDGDNYVDNKIFDHELDDTLNPDVVYSFKSKNVINGLEYGNGGIKCWNKDVLLASHTHESSDDTDFCWVLRYYQIDKLGSQSINNASAFQAWRAGFREGIKMSYINGKPMDDPAIQISKLHDGNRSKLRIWMSVGRDVMHGIWAIRGARQGFYEMYSGKLDHRTINDYDWFARHWIDTAVDDPELSAKDYAARIQNQWAISIPELDSEMSVWFKSVYLNPARSGMML